MKEERKQDFFASWDRANSFLFYFSLDANRGTWLKHYVFSSSAEQEVIHNATPMLKVENNSSGDF